MTAIETKNLEPISTQIFFGEENRSDSLKAYKYENELKREVNKNKMRLKYYLFNKYKIPFEHEVKVSEPGEKPITERFTIIELINDKLTTINSKMCISTYEIYRTEGILKAIESLHNQTNLMII